MLLDISKPIDGTSHSKLNDPYFKTLQLLSTSRWTLYESRTVDRFDDFVALKDTYGSLLNDIASQRVRDTGSIQVTAPPRYGKSALLKLIAQEIRQKSSVLVIENSLPSPEQQPSLYSLHVSFIHQIISQRPSLFYAVRNLIDEMLRHQAWTEEMVRILLEAMLHHGRTVELLIVIYDYDDWPKGIISWWCETLRPLLKSCGSKFTFLTSSCKPIKDLSASEPHRLDLEIEYKRYKTNFVNVRLESLLDGPFGHSLNDDMKRQVLTKSRGF